MWLEHYQQFVKFIKKQVFESSFKIGNLHGTLRREYKKENLVDHTILKPKLSLAHDIEVTFISSFLV